MLQNQNNIVLLETIKSDEINNKSMLFSEPVEIIEAFRLTDVEEALKRVEEKMTEGYYAAGYIEYEAGYAFEEKFLNRMRNSVFKKPIVWFGIYKDFKKIEGKEHFEENNINKIGKIENIEFNIEFNEYEENIGKIKDYIRAGDTYQINYTGKLKFKVNKDVEELYKILRNNQRVSYAAFIKNDYATIISLSPELFFMVKDEKIVSKPMKGTVGRGKNLEEDINRAEYLFNSEKNRAENVMITDLIRNDIGRISKIGSVNVKDLFKIEKYETVFQMTSTVEAVLKSGVKFPEIIKAIFPCGSITGAPKIRSMEIIKELEKEKRGIYTGAVGYIAPNGEIMFNIAIRTLVVEDGSGEMGIGSGIVWDSSAEEEYKESILKSKFLSENRESFNIVESLLFRRGTYYFLKEHLERMEKSASYFGYVFEVERLTAELDENKEKMDDKSSYKVRIALNEAGEFNIENAKLPKGFKNKNGKVALSKVMIDSNNKIVYHKTDKRELYNEMHKRGASAGYDEVLFFNEKGELTEACSNNIMIKIDGKIVLPPVESGLLSGVMRRKIIEKVKNIEIRTISKEELLRAEKVYITNSVRGIREVVLKNEEIIL